MNKKFARNLVRYIEHSNKVILKLAQDNKERKNKYKEFYEKLFEALDVLAEKDIIPKDYKEGIFEVLKKEPEKVAELLIKAAELSSEQIGIASERNYSRRDPLLDFIFS